MAEEPQENGNRATVALVSEKVDGLKELIRAEFRDVQRQLDTLASIPEKVARLDERVNDLEDAERAQRIHWPSFLVSLVALAIASYGALT